MIKVEQLTKKYPGVVAINSLSFEVDKGEAIGAGLVVVAENQKIAKQMASDASPSSAAPVANR